jgi:hypothetical protein
MPGTVLRFLGVGYLMASPGGRAGPVSGRRPRYHQRAELHMLRINVIAANENVKCESSQPWFA